MIAKNNSKKIYNLLFFLIFFLIFFIIYSSQINSPLNSDLFYNFKFQVSDLYLNKIPGNIDKSGGLPMSLMEACKQHFYSFRRLNCGDIFFQRFNAFFTNDNLNFYIFSATIIYSISFFILDLILKNLSIPGTIRLIFYTGLIFYPEEIYFRLITAEQNFLVFLLLSIFASFKNFHWTSAILMFVCFFIKETTIVYWPFIFLFFLINENNIINKANIAKALKAHLLTSFVLVLIFCYFWFSFKENTSYVFLEDKELSIFNYFYVSFAYSLKRMINHHVVLWSFMLWSTVIFILLCIKYTFYNNLFISYQDYFDQLKIKLLKKNYLITIFVGLACIILHLIAYYYTNRYIGKGRYIVPINFILIIVLSVYLKTALRKTPRVFKKLLYILVILNYGYYFLFYKINDRIDIILISLVFSLITFLISIIFYLSIYQRSSKMIKKSLLISIIIFFLSPLIDQKIRTHFNERNNADSFNNFVKDIGNLPENSYVNLIIDDVYLSEQIMSLQIYLILKNRMDITLRTKFTNKSNFNDNTPAIAKKFHYNFNKDRISEIEARYNKLIIYNITLNKKGNKYKNPEYLGNTQWMKLLFKDFEVFVKKRYGFNKGYIDYDINKISY